MRRIVVAVVLACLAVPALAAIAPEITIPVAGRLVLPGRIYTTELTITNHRDVLQYVAVEFIDGRGPANLTRIIPLESHATLFADTRWITGLMGTSVDGQGIGAMRFTAVTTSSPPDDLEDVADIRDMEGQIEVKAFIINERGPFALHGTSRQEIEGVPLGEYTARRNTFAGVLHQPPTYTNVGIVNLDPVETVTFFVQFQYLEPVAVTVPPLSSQQIRIAGLGSNGLEGNAGRWVTVTPEWATDSSNRTTPWVAYASTVDGITGDAFSGVRIPVNTTIGR